METAWIAIALTVFTLIFLPCIGLLLRLTRKWTQAEDKLEEIAADLKDIVQDKTRAHVELYKMIQEDREAANRRLRWLEENTWKKR